MLTARVISGVANHFIMRLSEWTSALVLLNFGTTLLRTGVTFESPGYATMARVASEDTWGWCLLALAAVRLGALVMNGTFDWFARYSVYVRAVCASLSVFAWFLIGICLLAGNPSVPPGVGTYLTLMLTDIVMAGYIAGLAGDLERKRRDAAA